MKTAILALLLCLIARSAGAGPTFAIWGDDGTGLSPNLVTRTDKPFDVVVTLDSDGNDSIAAEWVMSDLRLEFPGVLLVQTTKIFNTGLDLGLNDLGEYLMAFGACAPPGDRLELLRLSYADFSGVIGTQSTLMTLRGFESSDSRPSSFNGQPGFVDCTEGRHGGEMGGHENAGALCVNCYEPPANETTISDIKAKF